MSDGVLGDRDSILPAAVTDVSLLLNNERVIPFPEVNHAIDIATEHLIAVLGVEPFRILENGAKAEGWSGYEFVPRGDWPTLFGKTMKPPGSSFNKISSGKVMATS